MEEERQQLQELRNAHYKRLCVLEVKAAKLGLETPASIVLEIEELRETLADIDQKLAASQQGTTFVPSGIIAVEIVFRGNFDSLTVEIRDASVRALAAAVNIPPEKIKVLRVIPGSIVYQLKMPRKAAYLLQDLYTSNDPLLVELEIEQVHIGKLRPIPLQLEKANLAGANLRAENLAGANLQGANLERTDLEGTDLNRATLRGAKLQGAKLQGATLQEANLEEANLEGANLEGASLDRASLVAARLGEAQLVKAGLEGVD